MATTALMPLDPAASSQQISRVLSIRANLLPQEIMAGRNARRMRVFVLVALVLVTALLGAWYAHALSQKKQADQDLDDVSAQVARVRASQNQYNPVVTVKTQNETIAKELKTLLASDLPWARLTDEIRDTGDKADVKVGNITGSLADASSSALALPSATKTTTVVTLQISGSAPDKKTIAKYVDQLALLDDLASPYLTSATKSGSAFAFTLNAEITSSALCGRFTTPCKSGGN
jgi:hypothetical protein